MEFTFLGTSSGTPTKSRNVSGLALRNENAKEWYLIDCGEGTQHRLLRTGLSLLTLETIFITHIHGDHCFGLPGLLGSTSMAGRQTPLTIVCPLSVKEYVESTIAITQMFLSFELIFVEVETTTQFETSQFAVTVQELSHRVPSYGFKFTEKGILPKLNIEMLKERGIPSGPIWGQIQRGETVEHNGKTLNPQEFLLPARKARTAIVAGDNDTPGILAPLASELDLLIHESTYTEEMRIKMGDAPQHSSAEIVARFAEEKQIKNLVLTHFSPRYQEYTDESPCLGDIKEEASAFYKGALFLAKDYQRLTLSRDGVLQEQV